MNTKFDLSPLQELFITDISPTDLAKQLDEMAFSFFQIIIKSLHNNPKGYIPEDADMFIYRLKQLRDKLLYCDVIEEKP